MTQYSKMTFEEFVAYAKDYTIDGCHPQIIDEAIARLNSLHEDNKELKTENQILSQKRFNIFERIEYSDKLKIKAYKECIEKVKMELAPSVVNVPDMYEILDNLLEELERKNKIV